MGKVKTTFRHEEATISVRVNKTNKNTYIEIKTKEEPIRDIYINRHLADRIQIFDNRYELWKGEAFVSKIIAIFAGMTEITVEWRNSDGIARCFIFPTQYWSALWA